MLNILRQTSLILLFPFNKVKWQNLNYLVTIWYRNSAHKRLINCRLPYDTNNVNTIDFVGMRKSF